MSDWGKHLKIPIGRPRRIWEEILGDPKITGIIKDVYYTALWASDLS